MKEWVCPECDERLHSLEIREIYDGYCALFCPNCDYCEVRTGDRFDKHKEEIADAVKTIQSIRRMNENVIN